MKLSMYDDRMSKPLRIFFSVLTMLFAVVFPHFAQLPMMVYPVIVLTVIWIFLRITGRTFGDIGFRIKDISAHSIFVGGIIGIAFALFVYWVLGPLILRATGLPPADLKDFYFIRSNVGGFLTLLLIACLWVIPYEEIVFRGFIFTTIRELIGTTERSFWIAGLTVSFLFAFYHLQEGYSAVISIFIGAMLAIWLYKIFRGNLWYLISFHCAYDIVMLNFIRLGLM